MSSLRGSWWGDINSKPIIVAHRCGCGEAPENTTISCQQAITAGSSIIQVEVIPAKDGTPMVAQSDDLTRLTGKELKMSQLSVEEIPPLQQKISSFIPGLFPDLDTTNFSKENIYIPTLKSLLEAFVEADTDKKCALFVEPFVYDVKFIAKVAQVINEVGIGDRIIVGHPREATIQKKIIEIFPESQILLTMNQCLWMGFLFRLGFFPPEKVPKNRVINVFYPVKDFQSALKKVVQQLRLLLIAKKIGKNYRILVQGEFQRIIPKNVSNFWIKVRNNEQYTLKKVQHIIIVIIIKVLHNYISIFFNQKFLQKHLIVSCIVMQNKILIETVFLDFIFKENKLGVSFFFLWQELMLFTVSVVKNTKF
eukprot:TRINITY_DN17171_c0_g2_i1.p1 TRINITY_DN17171_c0_g2~~TRINITY_DN17171_c0_g2_i1.p1  ORF type:complete len:365 (-),score=34.42 TRINITY_DN17171_c0_g2_i1:899-1993(-)